MYKLWLSSPYSFLLCMPHRRQRPITIYTRIRVEGLRKFCRSFLTPLLREVSHCTYASEDSQASSSLCTPSCQPRRSKPTGASLLYHHPSVSKLTFQLAFPRRLGLVSPRQISFLHRSILATAILNILRPHSSTPCSELPFPQDRGISSLVLTPTPDIY